MSIISCISQMRKPKLRVVTSLVQDDVTCEDIKLGLEPRAHGSKAKLASGQPSREGRSVLRRGPAGSQTWAPTLALPPTCC